MIGDQVGLAGGREHAGADDQALARHDREEAVDRREGEEREVDPGRAHRVLDELGDRGSHGPASLAARGPRG